MPNRIKILSEFVANKIAAGEVVERPAAVVKELVENSLDASATDISVHIQAGGKRLVRVVDDGFGMSRDDSLLAFERFGTSKVETSSDLDHITTLGFRGEALASIASVSQVALKTRQRGDAVGTLVVIHGGVLKKVEEVGCPEGTIVEVSNLFYNTPARRAFMSSTDTEFFWISQTVSQYALCRPKVSFMLTHNAKKVIEAPVSEDFKHRIAAVMGPEVVDQLIPISVRSDELSLKGYIGLPTKASTMGRRLQSLFINRRAVNSKPILNAIYEAYGPYLMRGRHPALVVFLDLDPVRVNVNVHPTKRQVRFAREREVCEFTRNAVEGALRKSLRGPVVEVTEMLRSRSAPPAVSIEPEEPKSPALRLSPEPAEKDLQTTIPETFETHEKLLERARTRADAASTTRQSLTRGRAEELDVEAAPEPKSEAQPPTEMPDAVEHPGPVSRRISPPERAGAFEQRLAPVGQIDSSFIVAQGGGVFILDQHAAHERVLFEKFLRQVRLGKIPSQRLLMPTVLDVSPPVCQLLVLNKELLESVGLEIADFGGGSLAVKSKPALLSDDDVEEIIGELGELLAKSKSMSEASFKPVEEVCALYACKGAIKAGQRLSHEEMQELLDQLAKTERPMVCPHGRPTVIELDLDDLRKSFLRTAKKR